MLGQKTNLSKHIKELRASIALQGAALLALHYGLGQLGGFWSPHHLAWYQQHLNVLQGKQGSFIPSHRKKSSIGTESCCPSCERQCRRMSMSWALSGRYQQIPFAVSMSVTLLDLQSQLFHWSSPGAGSAGQQEAGTIPRLAVMCSLPLFCPQHKLTISEACGLKQPLGIALASKTLEVIAGSSGPRLLAAAWGSGDAQKNRV